ncbi:alpha/beta hydrolase [Nonomuraea sp. MTCD27]|uniref:alpha/beta hydrolase n=1 Tax=Nonomuraea sp. MTCD27 TaxID=1676747 RepID=UPI0035BF9F95
MDPELEAFVPLFPPADLSDPFTARKSFAELAARMPAPDTSGMEIEDRTVAADPDVPVRIYRPHLAHGAIVWLHGGGFVMGDVDTEHPWAARLADGSGAVVISVGYRLAPEHRFPAALDDAYAVLEWTAEHAAELGVDPERIAVGGHSAGGGLAAAVALRAREEQGPPIRFQLLNQPGLDDRLETWSARNFTDTPWLNRGKLAAAWRHYLGDTPATQPNAPANSPATSPATSSATSPYAAPARATDLSGLPPAYVATAELCPNRDEDIAYALRLLQAGVSVELHQWPGTFHGSQAIMSAEVSQRQIAELGDTLRRALAG